MSPKQKAALAHHLIGELDGSPDSEVDSAWRAEVEKRYSAYLNGDMESVPGEEVMTKARKALNR